MKNNPKTKKETRFNQPITSYTAQDGTLYELLYDSELQQTHLICWQDNDLKTRKSFLLDNGKKLEPYSPHNPLIHKRLILFAGATSDYGSKRELLKLIRSFIHRFVDLTDTFELIASYYVLLTWVFDRFNEIPYLRVRGDYGSGKTRFLQTVGSLCYKPIFASGASTVAPIFHILNQIGGTLILDEGDFRFSDEKADIAKILNNGNAKGFPVLRCEKINQREFAPKAYEVFGPKIVASRNDYQDRALESRFISEDMGLRKVRENIPITLPDSFEREALELRNKLLLWRFQNYGKHRDPEDYTNRAIELRLNQIYAPLLTLVTNQSDKKRILAFARAQNKQNKVDRGQLTEVHVLLAIKKADELSKGDISISEITRQFIQLYENEYERKITHRYIGSVVRKKLRLKTRKTNGRYILAENQQKNLQHLFDKYGL